MKILFENDVRAVIGTIHNGFQILKAQRKYGNGTCAVALAKAPNGQYVTWQWHIGENGCPDFYWDHISERENRAKTDFNMRVQNA